ncbi:3-phosphoserine/phosphohydroxythreonine transaminase [Alkalicoccobacillus plakortidis]|uniref:Phosphoserine aminotransferase n=1 Tax=Alkalicoccobacillus plakortidis TaxID=444060 RepID=A0ABT0XL85_9BACI|nr:3-phosphoserine/phosphohydroxythreonine transaminase [Alkalicoccobacillus plakortidis]MCM2676671.1 3-phosphoserine/phosphohydroxythreonine transaminase [Alkalicoccobacillus plakortidis]
MSPVYNFNAGPAALPKPALEAAQKELLNFNHTGMSVMELSHRSSDYDAVHQQTKQLLKKLMNIPDTHEILFIQGGASLQFAMLPYNLLSSNKIGQYVLTGSWSEKAVKEASFIGETNIAASTKESNYTSIPDLKNVHFSDNDAYVHITSNNTIYGTQWKQFPDLTHAPLVADMSSDILSRSLDVEKFGLIYAGAQKNLGPSGVTVVIAKKEIIDSAQTNHVPTMLRYSTFSKNDSLYNTPPTFGIYLLGKVLEWVESIGGLTKLEEANEEKARVIYETIDENNGFFSGHAEASSRSLMNVTFTLPNEELSKSFLTLAKERGFVGLNGHRSIGGCRASIYNAVPLEACVALRDLMIEFKQAN